MKNQAFDDEKVMKKKFRPLFRKQYKLKGRQQINVKILSKGDLSLIESLLDKAVGEMKGEERERIRELAGKAKAILEIDVTLQDIIQRLERIEGKIDRIAAPAKEAALPERLRLTLKTLREIGEASASQVAERTGRTRAAESAALNELTRIGFVERRRKRRTVYFKPAED